MNSLQLAGRVADELLGRVNSAYRMLGWGTLPIGAILGGLIASAFGLRAPFLVGGVSALLLAGWVASRVTNRSIRRARQRAAGAPIDDDQDERPAPNAAGASRGPVFNTFPQPQVVNPQRRVAQLHHHPRPLVPTADGRRARHTQRRDGQPSII